jgi:hypothetical protein
MHDLFFPENLRKPARWHRAAAMRKFPTGQVDSTRVVGSAVVLECFCDQCVTGGLLALHYRGTAVLTIIYRLLE